MMKTIEDLAKDYGHYGLIAVVTVAAILLKPTEAPEHQIQDGPMCFMAENPPETASKAPLPPPPPPLPVLWDNGTDAEIAAVNDILWSESSDPLLMAALIKVESSGNPRAVSSAGAGGLMQLMPKTAESMAAILDLDYSDELRFAPAWNVRVGVAYFEWLLVRFAGNTEHALTAYHRGIGNTRAILRTYGELPSHVKAMYSDLVLQRKGQRQ
jgi:soluble lytic murein transglycosylase-like protein